MLPLDPPFNRRVFVHIGHEIGHEESEEWKRWNGSELLYVFEYEQGSVRPALKKDEFDAVITKIIEQLREPRRCVLLSVEVITPIGPGLAPIGPDLATPRMDGIRGRLIERGVEASRITTYTL